MIGRLVLCQSACRDAPDFCFDENWHFQVLAPHLFGRFRLAERTGHFVINRRIQSTSRVDVVFRTPPQRGQGTK